MPPSEGDEQHQASMKPSTTNPAEGLGFAASDVLSPGVPNGIYPQFLMLGDSITQFGADEIQLTEDELTHHIQPVLQKHYNRRLDIVNRGCSGYTSSMGLQTLQYILPVDAYPTPAHNSTTPHIKLTTIFYGANDACLPGNTQHVPLDIYKSNLIKLTSYAVLQRHKTKVIIITPPPVNEHQLSKPLTRTAQTTATYALAARDVARSKGIPCVDVWSAFMRCCQSDTTNSTSLSSSSIPLNPKDDIKIADTNTNANTSLIGSLSQPPHDTLASLLVDGLHLTSKGYKVLYDELLRVIDEDLPECRAENVPFVFRPWNDCFDLSSVR